MSDKEYTKLTVVQLKEELTKRGLETSGKKQDLVTRLSQADAAEADTEMSTDAEVAVTEEASMETGEEQEQEQEQEAEPQANGEETQVNQDVELDREMDEDAQGGTGDAGEGEETAEGGEGSTAEGSTGAGEGSSEGADGSKHEGEGQKEEEKEEKEDEEPFEEDPKLMARLRRRGTAFDMMKAKMDRIRDVRTRTLLAYPITHEDLNTDWLKAYLDNAQQFFIRFFEYDASKCTRGSLELRMRSSADAAEAIEDLPKKKEDIQVQLLKPNDVVDKILLTMKGVTDDPRTSIAKRMLVVEDLPSEPNEDALKDIFSDASYVFIPRELEGKMKGYAYAEYETSEKCKEADKRLQLAEPELDGKTLFIRPMFVDESNKLEVFNAEEREALKVKVAELKAQKEEASKEEEPDKDKIEQLTKEIDAEQRKLTIDQHVRRAQNRMQKQYKRKQPYQHRGDPAKRFRQQNWGQHGAPQGNMGRGGPGFRRGGPPNLLDMPPNRRGPGGNPNAQAVQSLLVGLSQMLNTGGTPGRGGYQGHARGGARGGSSSWQQSQTAYTQPQNFQRNFTQQGRGWNQESRGSWDNQGGYANQSSNWGQTHSGGYGGAGGRGGGKWGGRGQSGMRGKFRR